MPGTPLLASCADITGDDRRRQHRHGRQRHGREPSRTSCRSRRSPASRPELVPGRRTTALGQRRHWRPAGRDQRLEVPGPTARAQVKFGAPDGLRHATPRRRRQLNVTSPITAVAASDVRDGRDGRHAAVAATVDVTVTDLDTSCTRDGDPGFPVHHALRRPDGSVEANAAPFGGRRFSSMADPAAEARIRDLERRLDLDPGSRLFVSLAEEYRKVGRVKDALSALQKGLLAHPGYIAAQVALGRAYIEANQATDAIATFTKVLVADPANLVAAKSLADIHLAPQRQPRGAQEVQALPRDLGRPQGRRDDRQARAARRAEARDAAPRRAPGSRLRRRRSFRRRTRGDRRSVPRRRGVGRAAGAARRRVRDHAPCRSSSATIPGSGKSEDPFPFVPTRDVSLDEPLRSRSLRLPLRRRSRQPRRRRRGPARAAASRVLRRGSDSTAPPKPSPDSRLGGLRRLPRPRSRSARRLRSPPPRPSPAPSPFGRPDGPSPISTSPRATTPRRCRSTTTSSSAIPSTRS